FKILGKADLGTVPIEKPENTQIVKCKNCKAIYVTPMPIWNKTDFDKLYNNADTYFPESDKWLKMRETEIVENRFRRIQKAIRTEDKVLLEMGAGIKAFMAKYLYKKGWNVVLQEPSVEFSKVLKVENPSFDLITDLFFDIDSKNKFSLIYIDSVMEHVANPVDYVKKSAELLKSGGILYFISPNEHSFRNWARTIMKNMKGDKISAYLCPYNIPYHLIGFSRKSIEILADESGLELVKHIHRYDYDWFHLIKNKHNILKYPVSALLYFVDLVGWGCNQEIILRKK
ncbi:MAG: class I SAM-dependent methyltransferase, partial [Dysgonomonas sp.]